MIGNEQKSVDQRWTAYVDSGAYDAISHPKGGYSIGENVTMRTGIVGFFKGFTEGNSKVIIGLDRDPDGKELILDIDDIRPIGEVTVTGLIVGMVSIHPDKTEVHTHPDDFLGKNSKLN